MTFHSEIEIDPNDPWLGLNFLDPASRERLRRDPHPLLDNLRRVDPVHRTPIGVWQIARYADVLRVLRDAPVGVRTAAGGLPGLAPSLPDWGPGQFMLSQDPPNHTRLRKLVSKAFTPRAVERLRPRARALAEQSVSAALARGRMEVIEELALRIPATLICELMGVPTADQARFTEWTARATHLLTATLGNPNLDDAREAGTALAEYFRALHAERRSASSDDLMSQLVRAEEEGDRLSETELLSQSIGLLIAGFETTIGLIGNGVRALLTHPDQLAALEADPALVGSAVEECLRYDGPILLTIRITHEDTPFGDKVIPADRPIMCLLAAANHDPAHFDNPDVFDIRRKDNDHLAFGGGAHFCLGAHLARMETQVAIGGLVRRVRGLALESDSLVWGKSLFRVLGSLPVGFQGAR